MARSIQDGGARLAPGVGPPRKAPTAGANGQGPQLADRVRGEPGANDQGSAAGTGGQHPGPRAGGQGHTNAPIQHHQAR